MDKLWFAIIALLISSTAYSDSSSLNLALPSAGSTYGEDSIRSGDLECSNAIGGATQLEFGLTGIVDNATGPFGSNSSTIESTKDIGVYARIVIPLDGPKERINCNSLYELELRKKRLEVLRLQEELEALRRLSANGGNRFEN